MLRDPTEENVIPIVEELRRRLRSDNVINQAHGEGRENINGQHDLDGVEEDGMLYLLLLSFSTDFQFATC